ncbi:ATPase, T2SS/T4P/T4SS family [Pseudobdellovibrio exovorus]|uniref:Flp pilus assembly protein TadA n=1 Tax=Pseudobdellovibrio exovorus JSS TaxID=1184267 RepID=M4VTR1_9BACT|nr:ATPase, T2SS/T4P/T4SS family [Pseudobdellovibrio exovorus]AGH96589.1 Flp pilus assembly protein TadA [Pseudobdellovibrio exovorus JSS]
MALNPQCHLIAVLGGKGGVGKSVFAANLAAAIAMELRVPTLLVDCDSKSVGDQNIITGLKPVKTLRELANSTQSLNSTPLQQIVTPHPGGFSYLGAVRGPEEILSVSSDNLSKLFEFLSRSFKFIVVDLGNDIGPMQNTVLQDATAITIVSTPEILVVQQTQRMINELLTQALPKEMFQLILNKFNNSGLAPQVIGQHLGLAPLSLIPSDEASTAASLTNSKPFVLTNPKSPLSAAYFDIVRKLTGGVLQRLKNVQRPKPVAPPVAANTAGAADAPIANPNGYDAKTLLKLRIHSELIRTVDLKKILAEVGDNESKEKELRAKTQRDIGLIVDREAPDLPRDERQRLVKDVLEEALGLGPLEDMLADPSISEIMVNGANRIFIEKGGKVQLSGIKFTSNDHLRRIIERIVTPLGRQINNATPYVDARLKDGSRVNAVIEPLSLDGPALTIRKFKKGGISAEKYIEFGSATKNMLDFLRISVEYGYNVVISGGTGSGKTSLLNMISQFIPAHERVITVEDAAELQLMQEHVVRLETRPPSMEGSNAVTIRDLIRNALRMRPDRIVVGETRDGAALDMLQAMNTGHDGSMTTTHANSPRECLARLETLVMMSGLELPVRAIREQIAGAVDLIVQIVRLSDGSRKIISITEVVGMQGDVITLAEIFKFKETGYDKNRRVLGQFQSTGTVPTFVQEIKDKGGHIPMEIFSNEAPKTTPPKPTGPATQTTTKPATPNTVVKKVG